MCLFACLCVWLFVCVFGFARLFVAWVCGCWFMFCCAVACLICLFACVVDVVVDGVVGVDVLFSSLSLLLVPLGVGAGVGVICFCSLMAVLSLLSRCL